MAKEKKIEEKNPTALDNALAEIEKQFGKGTIIELGKSESLNIDRISSGSLALDGALGGGIPRGRIIEIYGPPSSGKSTLCYSIVSNYQKLGLKTAWIDAEHAYDDSYAQLCQVDSDKLLFCQPDCGEDALTVVEKLTESGEVALIIVDSVAALTPRAEIQGEMGQNFMGLQARMMAQALRKLVGVTSKTNTTIIFLNQIRMKIGVLFGSPETTCSGESLKFFSSIRIDLRRKETIKQGENIIATQVKAKVVKNKTYKPFQEAIFEIHFDSGLCRVSDLILLGEELGILKKSGAWWSYKDKKNIAQGVEALRDLLKVDEELFEAIKNDILTFNKDKKE